LKILQVVDSLAAGGLERVAVELACGLRAEGHDTSLCVTRETGPLEDILPRSLDVLWLRRRSRWDLQAVRRLRKFIKVRGIEVVHAHGTSIFIAALALAGLKGPLLIWHDHFGDLNGRGRSSLPYRLVGLRIDGIIPVSRELERWAQVHLSTRKMDIRVIENAVGGMVSKNAHSDLRLRGSLGYRVVCVANFRHQKDHPTLIRAFSMAAEQLPGTRLFLVGMIDDTEYMEEVRRAVAKSSASGQIEILGLRTDVPELLDVMDVGVLASRSEGLPLALLEYAMAGLGVVVTGVGDIPSVVEDGRSGLVVPPGDAAAFAEALVTLLKDPVRRTRMGKTLREKVSRRFGMDRMVGDVLSFYTKVMSGRAS